MDSPQPPARKVKSPLRRGWTTGACATAAAKSALSALLGQGFVDPVTIALPGGQTPAFALAHEALFATCAEAGIIKDAGDDPDITHGALIVAQVAFGAPGGGIVFAAGPGVGTVTKPGLPVPVGQPAINPVPRQMMAAELTALCVAAGRAPDLVVTLSVPDGARLAQETWNPRLGILGGLSILGTTGIVVPYSCAAWIHSIQSGIDVARAEGLSHVVGATGDRSERAARARLGLPESAYLDMGDFVGGLIKYLKRHPVDHLTIAGGVGKLTKLAQGAMDLHSARSQVDFDWLAAELAGLGADEEFLAWARNQNLAQAVVQQAIDGGLPLAGLIARKARDQAQRMLGKAPVAAHIILIDRNGTILAEA